MSSDTTPASALDTCVVRAEHIGKCFNIFEKPSQRLAQILFGSRRFAKDRTGSTRRFGKEFWALRDVSFELDKGECLGVLGANGSGKSTLLQIVAGTLPATEGACQVNGTVAALLELGSGFNPEFTGRENVYLNGAILGVSEAQLRERFDDIAAFAAIGEFIDQPVKTYSSGMMLRLAFAVQILVEPEVLIVDEALAVGDARFQLKCMSRLEEMRAAGTSLMFVSHSIEQVKKLCSKAIVLDHGRVVMAGDPVECGVEYYKLLFPSKTTSAPSHTGETPLESDPTNNAAATPSTNTHPDIDLANATRYGRGGAELIDLRLHLPADTDLLAGGEEVEIDFAYRFDTDRLREVITSDAVEPFIILGMRIDSTTGVAVTDMVCERDEQVTLDEIEAMADDYHVRLRFRVPHLQQGEYFLSPAIAAGRPGAVTPIVEYVHLLSFRVAPARDVHGLMRFEHAFERVEAAAEKH